MYDHVHHYIHKSTAFSSGGWGHIPLLGASRVDTCAYNNFTPATPLNIQFINEQWTEFDIALADAYIIWACTVIQIHDTYIIVLDYHS